MTGDGSDLDHSSNDHDEATEEDRVSSSESLSVEKRKDGTEEASNFVDGGDGALHGAGVGVVGAAGSDERKG